MPDFSAALLVLIQIFALGAITLVLHRSTARIGLTPLLLFLGMLTAGLQMRLPGVLLISTGEITLNIAIGSFTLLPVLLLGLLIIYIFNGTHQARMTLLGMLIITLLIAVTRLFPSMNARWFGYPIVIEGLSGLTPWELVSSALALLADLVVLIVAYQAISNLRGRFPSPLGAASALFIAVWVDAAAYATLATIDASIQPYITLVHLAGKSFAVLILSPLLVAYLTRFGPKMPESAASFPRPALDLFTTTAQIEARARFHYNMLRTLSQIDQLILRTDDPETLLSQACKLLVRQRSFSLVWIGFLEEDRLRVRPVVQAGSVPEYLAGATIIQDESSNELTPTGSAIRSGKASVVWDISQEPYHIPWRSLGVDYGIHSMAVFPMRHGGRILGTLNIYTHKHNAFDPEEIELLQELGDDLAYALISLEARRQQAVLKTATDTMQDGMFIMDMHGEIIYNNPAIARMVNCRDQIKGEDLSGIDFRKLIPTGEGRQLLDTHFQRLLEYGRVDFEYEHNPGERNYLALSINASLVGGDDTEDTVIVVNLHDTTRRRMFERQLMSLNTFVTEMVQAYELEDLMGKIFLAAERLLEANASAVYIADTQNKKITSAYYHKLPEGYLKHLRPGYAGLPGDKVLSTGLPVLIPDTQRDEEFDGKLSFLSEFGIYAAIVLPVFFQEMPLGTLVAYYHKPREITEEDVQMGLTLARTLAIVMQNIRLFESEHSQRHYAEALTQAAAAVNTSLELDLVLDRILEQTLQVVGCRSVNLMLIEGANARVMRTQDAVTPERAKQVEGKLVPLSIPTLETMMTAGEPLAIPDTRKSPLWSEVENTKWILSYAAAPLIVHNQIIGFLSMNSDEPDYFSETITRRIQAFAETAATAIQNARLYESLRGYSQQLEDRVYERTAELSETKEQIERIILSVPDAVFVLDERGRLIQTNPAGESLLTDSKEQNIDLFAEEFIQTLERGSTSDPVGILEISERAYQALASPLPDSGTQSGKVVVFRDVTRFRELDRLKTQFVSDVSHELRTPLTNLSIYLDLLSSVTDQQKRSEYLDTLRRETVRLTHLIEDLLTISRLEAGRLEFNIRPVNVARVVHNLAEDRAAMAAQRSLELSDTSLKNLPLAWADARLLTQVLSNLLTNALNYTLPEGRIMINADCHEQDGEKWVRIRVQDTGVGVEAEEIQDLFKRFYRGKASRTTGAPGTGLGLAISKEIIERFGGRISLERHPKQGSSFIVWLHPVL